MPNNDHVRESLPGYVLGSLDEDEAQAVATHLAGCTLCRSELDALQAVADQLPLAGPDALPPADLKPRLMQRVQGLNAKRPSRSASRLVPRRLWQVGAAAGLLLIVGLAVSSLLLWQKIASLEVLAGPLGMRAIALQNTDAAPGASGFVVMGADGRNGVLVVDKLPQLAEGQSYQVWLVRDAVSTKSVGFSVCAA